MNAGHYTLQIFGIDIRKSKGLFTEEADCLFGFINVKELLKYRLKSESRSRRCNQGTYIFWEAEVGGRHMLGNDYFENPDEERRILLKLLLRKQVLAI
jgi:hypothetical protein